MKSESLYNESGRKVAEIKPSCGSRVGIYTAGGRKLGEYDLKTNATYNATNKRIGTGNQLTSLL
ncbi:MAG: hypothetical protein ACXW2E_00685 [Nitrososphaeraceae archaeon]